MTVGLRIQLWAQKVLTLEGVLPPYLLEIDLFYKPLRFTPAAVYKLPFAVVISRMVFATMYLVPCDTLAL